MAMILRGTRSLWAMYETGKRDLPPTAQLKLIQLLAFIKEPKTEKADSFLDVTTEKAKTKKVFENLKLINAHQQILTEHKLKAIEKKYKTALTALRLFRFLETNNLPIATKQKALLTVLKLKAENNLRKNGVHVQAKLRFKWKLLLLEEKQLNEIGQNYFSEFSSSNF